MNMNEETKNHIRNKILIVDDTPENLDILLDALSDEYAVIPARNGNKALKLARNSKPDVILLDVMMPGIDGYEVCRQLKADTATCDIPVIFLTALTDEGNELKGLNEGAVDYVHKPISAPLVRARVATQLKLIKAYHQLANKVQLLEESALLRDDVDRILRHDLKGPLTPILAYLDLMVRDISLTASQQNMLKEIRNAGHKMLEMINNSLDLYKMETGSYILQPFAINISEILDRVLTGLEPLIKLYQVKIEHKLSPIQILGEDMLCFSLFNNLIKNAIEASGKGATIRITNIEADNKSLVSIENPTPVPESIRTNFFAKYTTANKKDGTGLGTYSAHLMARTMKGDITMETDDITGTKITVYLCNFSN